MKATELRIGNWVKIDSVDTQNQVTQILEKGVNCGSIGVLYEMIKPIPLTEEWLERFGFDKVANNTWLIEDGFYIDFKKGHITEQFVYWIDVNSKDNFILIHSVNQLQNIYFALTGKELTIK